jgi:hypothetical protein
VKDDPQEQRERANCVEGVKTIATCHDGFSHEIGST